MEKYERIDKTMTERAEPDDERVKRALSPHGGFVRAEISPSELVVYVKHTEQDFYGILYENKLGRAYWDYSYKEGKRLPDITSDLIKIYQWFKTDDVREKLYPNAVTIKKHPLYLAAKEAGDRYLLSDIAVHYGIGKAEDYEYLRSVDGLYRLPGLSDEYDINYCVKRNTIDTELLARSGYRISRMHPMGMNGRTHDAWTLNPHTKHGLDAAPVKIDGIEFEKYLKLFSV